jgi:predicted N-acyltransferase
MQGKILRSVDQVRKGDLDRIADSPLYTWGWLKAMEQSDVLDVSPRHLAVLDGGELVAFAPCFLQRSGSFDDLTRELFTGRQRKAIRIAQRLRVTHLEFNPALLVGVPEIFTSRVMVDPRIRGREDEAVDALLDALEGEARKEGILCGSLAVSEQDHILNNSLLRRGYSPCLRNANAVLKISWESFDQYLKWLSRNQRKGMKHERSRFHKLGLTLERLDDIGPHAERLSELAANVYAHHANGPCPFTPDFYRAASELMGRRIWVYSARMAGDIVGFSFNMVHRHNLFCHHWGSDYSPVSRRGHVYFVVGYQGPIVDAIDHGMESAEFGPAAWDEKRNAGCSFDKVRVYLRTRSRSDSFLLRLLMRRADRRLEDWLSGKLWSTQGGESPAL